MGRIMGCLSGWRRSFSELLDQLLVSQGIYGVGESGFDGLGADGE
jgi:hypothetical protein